jgi:hypothetical protein
MQQSPQLGITPDDDVTTSSAITTVWSTFGNKLLSSEMRGTSPSFTGATTNFYVVYKIF